MQISNKVAFLAIITSFVSLLISLDIDIANTLNKFGIGLDNNILFLLPLALIYIYLIPRFWKNFKNRRAQKEIFKPIKKHKIDKLKDEMNFNFNVINFQGIDKIQLNLPFEKSWIFLTGENGYGKTNILQAIARGLGSKRDNQIYNAIKPLNEDSYISIEINDFRSSINSNDISVNEKCKVVGYGAGRLDMGSDKNTKSYASSSSLFESQVLLRNIEKEGLSRWFFKIDEIDKFNETVEIFKKLLPNLADIVVDKDSVVWYIEKDKNNNPLEPMLFPDLATGYQNIISMVGDILLNLYFEKSNLKKIVLIDEIELYMHPNLQKQLPSLLSSLFPDAIFIVSTHSPLPLLGAPKNNAVYKVNRTQKEGISLIRLDEKIDIEQLLPNTILSSPIFGMDDILSLNYSKEYGINLENNFEDILKNKIKNAELEKFYTKDKEEELIKKLKENNSK